VQQDRMKTVGHNMAHAICMPDNNGEKRNKGNNI
jgi:hypothetical protein